MNQFDLGTILDELHEREFAEFRSVPAHHFSLRHRRAMRRIFDSGYGVDYKPVRISKRIVLIVAALLFLALITAGLVVFRIGGFSGIVHSDNINMFAASASGSPDVIEREYSLGYVPDGYRSVKQIGNAGDSFLMREFSQDGSGSYIVFFQYTKAHYNSHFDNEKSKMESVTVNGCDGFMWLPQGEGNTINKIVWADDDYVFSVSGDLDKEELMKSANSTKFAE